jgi:SAM-dependent MidA family methyltransferase
LRAKIASGGPLGFPDFMRAALYEPGLGYYARGTRQVGRAGDFFTSVSVGPLFGELLARRLLRDWRERGEPARWRIIESGAHDGTLAADVLTAVAALEPRAIRGLDYVIGEPLETLRSAQRETLARFGTTARVCESITALSDDPLPGIAFGNELLDALPFHVVGFRGGSWHECLVALTADGGFTWQSGEPDGDALRNALGLLGNDFPDGYRTEVRICYQDFLSPLAAALVEPLMIWPDYGFARSDYYHPARKSGTLRTFAGHRAAEDPLADPGAADITAHVDFTAVAEAAISLGGRPVVFRNQGSWLTENSRDWLLGQEGAPQPALMRQFQTLVHPAHLGGSFQILELSWNPATPADPGLHDRLFT